MDDGAPATQSDLLDTEFGLDSLEASGEEQGRSDVPSEVDSEYDAEDDAENDQNSQPEGEALDNQPTPPVPTIFSKSRKAPAWTDPDDPNLQVSIASDRRLRKLRDAPSEDQVGGREYESRLRRQFEKINPTPDWAANARRKLHPAQSKRRRLSHSSASEDGEGAVEDLVSDLLTSTNGIIEGRAKRSRILPQGTLAIERLRDANQASKAEGEVKVVQFHPSPQVPVLLTASVDRRLRLFNVCRYSTHQFLLPLISLASCVFLD